MLTSPFPDFIGFAAVTGVPDVRLAPAEAALLSRRAGPKRRRDFLLGRAAARCALERVGFECPPPVLRGPANEPLWPAGFVGSITHAGGTGISAVAPAGRARGIGVDLEERLSELQEDITTIVCTPAERAWVAGDDLRCRQVFSAKEAAFKAFFPLCRRFIDFLEVTLSWDERRAAFHGRFLSDMGSDIPATFTVGSRLSADYIFSHIVLPAGEPAA